MNRRSFLNALGLVSAGMALDPERLLWVPGAKTIFIPTPAPLDTDTKLLYLQLYRAGIITVWEMADAFGPPNVAGSMPR